MHRMFTFDWLLTRPYCTAGLQQTPYCLEEKESGRVAYMIVCGLWNFRVMNPIVWLLCNCIMVFTHTSLVLKYGEVKQEDIIERNSWKLRARSLKANTPSSLAVESLWQCYHLYSFSLHIRQDLVSLSCSAPLLFQVIKTALVNSAWNSLLIDNFIAQPI